MALAVLYLPEPESRFLARRPVAGRSLILRAVVAAARAGAVTVAIPDGLRTHDLERALARVRGLVGLVRWLDGSVPADDLAGAGAPCLLLPASTLVDACTLQALYDSPAGAAGVVVEESVAGEAPVLLAPTDLVIKLWDGLATGRPLGEKFMRHVRAAHPTAVRAAGLLVAVRGEHGLADAEAALYARLGTGDDCAVDRILHRRCSRGITRLLARTPATPNQVSVASLAIGCGAIWALWSGSAASAALGVILYALATVADHSDGELARLTLQESNFGARLDLAIDTLIHSVLVLAMAVSAGPGPAMIVVGAAGAVGVTLSALLARSLSHEIKLGATAGGVLRNMGNRDLFYVLLLGFVLLRWRLPALLPALALLVAVGSQWYWIACLARIRRAARPRTADVRSPHPAEHAESPTTPPSRLSHEIEGSGVDDAQKPPIPGEGPLPRPERCRRILGTRL